MFPGSEFTGFVYAAIGQNAAEQGYVKIGYAEDPIRRYASGKSGPYRRIFLIQPDVVRKNRDAQDRVVQGDLEQHVLDFFRKCRGNLYDGRSFPPGYAELVKFDAEHRARLKQRLAEPQRRTAPEAIRFLKTLLALWDEQMPADPWQAGAPLPDLVLAPPQRVTVTRKPHAAPTGLRL